MNNYKGYEIFSDPAYFDMVCIRKTGSKNFNETIHVDSVQGEAAGSMGRDGDAR